MTALCKGWCMVVALAVLAGARVSAAEVAPADGHAVPRAWLGVHLEANQPPILDEDEKLPPGAGFISVFAGGPADRAGFRKEDRVIRFEGQEIRHVDDLRVGLGATQPGQETKATVLRAGQEVELKVVMGTFPGEAEWQRLRESNEGPNQVGWVHFGNSPAPAAGSMGPDRVTLSDGNRLEGRVKGLSATELVLALESGAEITLEAGQVTAVRLAPKPEAQPRAVAVLLRKGGWLTASQMVLHEDGCQLTLADGGTLELSRSEVEEVGLSPTETPAFYRGPTAGDGWQALPENSWGFGDGAWQGLQDAQRGLLARKFADLPGAMEFSFDATLPQHGSCSLVLYAFRAGQAGIQSSPGSMQILLTPDGPQLAQNRGDTVHALSAGQPVKKWKSAIGKPIRYTILADRQKGTLILLVDGVVWKRYETDKVVAEDLPRAGRVMQFAGAEKLKISKIRLRPWIGGMPQAEAGEDKDWIASGEEEGRSGEIVSITPAAVTLAGGRAVPRTQPVLLRFKAPPAAAPAAPPGAGGVWVETNDGSAFAADSVVLAQGKVVARTAFAQEYQMPMEALRSLDFRRDPRSLTPDRRSPPGDVLTLRDGRQLTGKLVPPLGDGPLHWQIAAARQPLVFTVKEAASIVLAPSGEAGTVPQSVVRLRNGDWLPGEIVGWEAGALQLKTSFSERLSVSRDRIQSIYLAAGAAEVSDGTPGRPRGNESGRSRQPRGNDAGTIPPGYVYQDGGYSRKRVPFGQWGGEGIFLPIPKATQAVSIEFTVTTPRGFLNFQLMGKKDQPVFGVSGSGPAIELNGEGRNFSFPGKAGIKDGSTRVQVVLDPGERAIHLAINGQQAGTCQLKKQAPWVGIGGLFFLPFGDGYGIPHFRVSDIWVAPWPGNFGAAAPSGEGQVGLALANGDETTGTLLKLDGETVEIDTPAGRLSLPLARVRAVEVHAPAAPAAAAYRVRLHDCGLISASALRITEKSVILQTDLGELDVPLLQVREIVFPTTL